MTTADLGLLILRLTLGLLIAGHGAQKLFGLFGGHGLVGTGGFFASIGFRPGKAMAIVAGVTELGSGLLLVLGLLTPLAAAGVIGTLLVAGSVHAAKGLWSQNGGYELALIYALVGAALALTGPGSISLDAALGLRTSFVDGLGAIVLGVIAGTLVVARARAAVRADATA